MPEFNIRLCNYRELIAGPRGRKSTVLQHPAYTRLITKISDGLKPEEAIEVNFPVSNQPGMKSIKQTFKRALKEYLQKLGLNSYVARVVEVDGTIYASIANLPPITGLKAMPGKEKHRAAR